MVNMHHAYSFRATLFTLLVILFYAKVNAKYEQNYQPISSRSYNNYGDYNDNSIVWSRPEECARTCRDGEPPKYCYYRFRVEYYPTMGADCVYCNQTFDDHIKTDPSCQCIIADGVERTVFSINRLVPGPFIQTCLGDRVVVDVSNMAEGIEVAIHWHGLFQKGYQYYDGVPHLTQCPIGSANTFRYQFAVNNEGTHWYHSHISVHMLDGQVGALIVRTPPNKNPHKNLYDEDNIDHVMFVNDWLHEFSIEKFPGHYHQDRGQVAQNFLINGRGNWQDPKTKQWTNAPLAVFKVASNKRYRIRFINGFSTTCGARLTIESHTMTIIAQDGENVEPVEVDAIITFTGERVDFIINANKAVKSYWIKLEGLGECAENQVMQLAILQYIGAPETPSSPRPTYSVSKAKKVYNSLDATQCNDKPRPDRVCINQLKAATIDSSYNKLMQVYPDKRFYFAFNFKEFNKSLTSLFKEGTYKQFFVAIDKSHIASMINNVSYEEPPSPPLSQIDGTETMCTNEKLNQCEDPCKCTPMYPVNIGDLVEFVVYDADPFPLLAHPFHLHGASFKVFAMGQWPNATHISRDNIDKAVLEHQNRIKNSQYNKPPGKDTIQVPTGGYVIVRFIADNPGLWLFHCHFSWHTATGMNVVIQVGGRNDIPPKPDYFPTCYNFMPQPQF